MFISSSPSNRQHFFSAKARSIEEASILYACVSRLMGQGGVIMVTIVRYSAIPGYVITAIQSTVGMSFWLYLIAVVLSIPKSYAFVYLGVALGRVKGEATPDELRVGSGQGEVMSALTSTRRRSNPSSTGPSPSPSDSAQPSPSTLFTLALVAFIPPFSRNPSPDEWRRVARCRTPSSKC